MPARYQRLVTMTVTKDLKVDSVAQDAERNKGVSCDSCPKANERL